MAIGGEKDLSMGDDQLILTGQSCARDPREAVRELRAAIARPDASLVVFFSSSSYDRDVLAAELTRAFGGVQVVGCTTAGEIGPGGCRDHSLTGVSFPAGACTAVVGRLGDLSAFSVEEGVALARELRRKLAERTVGQRGRNEFAVLVDDGLRGGGRSPHRVAVRTT